MHKLAVISILTVIILIGSMFSLVFVPTFASPSSPWPQFGRDWTHTGYTNLVYGPPENKTKWVIQLSTATYRSIYNPAIGPDGTIYVTCEDGYLYAVNPDGTLKWKVYVFGYKAWLHANPAVGDDGTIYTAGNYSSSEAYVYAFNPDGTLKWKYRVSGNFYEFTAITIGPDGTIYAANSRGMYALNPDGTLKWKYIIGKGTYTPAVDSNGNVYFGCNDGYFYALNPDGTLKWKYQVSAVGTYIEDSPAIAPDGTIYAPDEDGYLWAFNPDGTLKWRYGRITYLSYGYTFGDDIYAPAVGPDGTVYFLTYYGRFYALNPDGTLKWKKDLYAGDDSFHFHSIVVDTNGTIYFGDYWDGYIWAFNPDGTVKWKYYLPSSGGWPWRRPALGSDGTLYIGSTDGKLYAFIGGGSARPPPGNKPPSIKISAVQPPQTYRGYMAAIFGTCNDDYGIKEVTISVIDPAGNFLVKDAKANVSKYYKMWRFNLRIPSYAPFGYYSVIATATDIYGNSASIRKDQAFLVLSTPPSRYPLSFQQIKPHEFYDNLYTMHTFLSGPSKNTTRFILKLDGIIKYLLINSFGILYAGTDKAIYAIDPNGTILWKFGLEGPLMNMFIDSNDVIHGVAYSLITKKYYAFSLKPDGTTGYLLDIRPYLGSFILKDNTMLFFYVSSCNTVYYYGCGHTYCMVNISAVDAQFNLKWDSSLGYLSHYDRMLLLYRDPNDSYILVQALNMTSPTNYPVYIFGVFANGTIKKKLTPVISTGYATVYKQYPAMQLIDPATNTSLRWFTPWGLLVSEIVPPEITYPDPELVKVKISSSLRPPEYARTPWHYVFDPTIKSERDLRVVPSLLYRPIGTALSPDGYLYSAGGSYELVHLEKIDPSSGAVKWRVVINGSGGRAFCVDPVTDWSGTVYYVTWQNWMGSYVYAFNPDGTVKWVWRSSLWAPIATPAIGIGSEILYVALDNNLVAIGDPIPGVSPSKPSALIPNKISLSLAPDLLPWLLLLIALCLLGITFILKGYVTLGLTAFVLAIVDYWLLIRPIATIDALIRTGQEAFQRIIAEIPLSYVLLGAIAVIALFLLIKRRE